MNKHLKHWNRLDNAAKIFPSTTTREDAKVFRFSCELTEPVQQPLLQQALEKNLERFPMYRSTLRRGLFWYYMEPSQQIPTVKEEDQPPCSPLYQPDKHSLLFSVTYYHCRINLEVYHVLTDGTGALAFLRMLVFHYLQLAHPQACAGVDMQDDTPMQERMDDSFAKYYTGKQAYEKQKVRRAYQLSGPKLPDCRMNIIEGTASVGQLREIARRNNTTISILLCSVLLQAIHQQMPRSGEKRPINIIVPVNLRNYFPSHSGRNFFSVVNIGYDFDKWPGDLPHVLQCVKESFARELEEGRIKGRMNELGALEHQTVMRMVPLPLKDVALKLADWMAEREATTAFSNIGKIDMPQPLAPYIRQFGVFITTKRIQVCLCSYEDCMSMSFTSPFISTEVQRHYFRLLTELGVDVTVAANCELAQTQEREQKFRPEKQEDKEGL